jgi:hypothetical protein
LTAWQSAVKNSLSATKKRLEEEGNTVFFIGHKLMIERGTRDKSNRARVLLRD